MFSRIVAHKLRRRSFLAGLGALAALPILAACEPQVVTEEKVVVVEREVPIERVVTQVVQKEVDKLITVEVEKPVEVERIVTVEVEEPVEVERIVTVEVEKVVTATTVTEEPKTEPRAVEQSSIVARLKRNAEEFEYAIGKPGGTLTFATVSEPLTLNLAIANHSSSSIVLVRKCASDNR